MGCNGTNIMTIRAFIRECEAKIERKDRIVWTVEDGVAYEESSGMSTSIIVMGVKTRYLFLLTFFFLGSLEPRRNTSAVKGKKQSLKEKITESKI